MTTFTVRALLVSLALVSACRQPQRQTGEPLGCGSDRDCKGDRLCEEGQCVLPKTSQVAPKSSEPALSDQDRLRALDDKERKICEERTRRYESQHKYDLAKRQAQFEEFTSQLAQIQELQQRLIEWQHGTPVQAPPQRTEPVQTNPPPRETQQPPPSHNVPPDLAPSDTPTQPQPDRTVPEKLDSTADPVPPPTDDTTSGSSTQEL